MANPNPIRKIETLAGSVAWQIDGRRFNASPARPQFKTKEEAEDALAEMIAKRKAGLSPTRRGVSFQMQADAYLKNAEDALAARTLRVYAAILKVHLLPAFGTKRVIDINTPMIKSFLAAKAAAKHPKTGKRLLGLATCRLLRAVLSTIFESAVDDGLVPANPVAAARTGTRGRKAKMANKQVVEKVRPFTQEQVNAILEWCDARDQELGDFVFTMLRTGCRKGEARALKWSDIHDDQITIERSADDRNVITATKTGERREVDMSAALKDVLKLRRLKRERAGHGAGDDDHVFGNGSPIMDRAITHRFGMALKECEIDGHVIYDLRHTYASVLLARGANLLYVAKQLGHANAVTTLKYYGHFMKTEGVRFVELLDKTTEQIEQEAQAKHASE